MRGWPKIITKLSMVALPLTLSVIKPVIARPHQSFLYSMKMTPEDGTPDPVIMGRYSAVFSVCQKRAVTTLDNSKCYEQEFLRQDDVLNHTWHRAREKVPENERNSLLVAQRHWIADRDPFCKSVADGFAGGTIMPVVYSDCRVEQTIRRTIWLEALFQ